MKGYRTIIFNALVMFFGVAAVVRPEIAGELPDKETLDAATQQIFGAVGIIVGGVNTVLRAVTNTSIFKKE